MRFTEELVPPSVASKAFILFSTAIDYRKAFSQLQNVRSHNDALELKSTAMKVEYEWGNSMKVATPRYLREKCVKASLGGLIALHIDVSTIVRD